MTEPEKQFVIGINTEVERPEGWTAGQGGNLTFTASTLATDLAAALARVEAAEARADSLADTWKEDRTLLGRLEAAARAVVDAVWSPSTNVYLAGSLICRICMSPDGRHSPSCPVRTLAALLGEDAP